MPEYTLTYGLKVTVTFEASDQHAAEVRAEKFMLDFESNAQAVFPEAAVIQEESGCGRPTDKQTVDYSSTPEELARLAKRKEKK